MKNLLFSLTMLIVAIVSVNAQTAEKEEQVLAQRAAKYGEIFILNDVYSGAVLTTDSTKTIILFADSRRTVATSFLVFKKGMYYWDANGDGIVDGFFIDKNDYPGNFPPEIDFQRNQLTIMKGGPDQTELDLSDKFNSNFVFFNLKKAKVFSTRDKSIYNIPEADKSKYQETLQGGFMKVLKKIL